MSEHFYGASYVAAYLGVTLTTIHNWQKRDPEGFVQPEVTISGLSGKTSAVGWSAHQLRPMREWYGQRIELDADTAEAHWALVDSDLAKRTQTEEKKSEEPKVPAHIHPDQITFTIPGQRAEAEEAA